MREETLADAVRETGLTFPEDYSMSWEDEDGRHEASFRAGSLRGFRRKVNLHGPDPHEGFRDLQLVRGPKPPPPTTTADPPTPDTREDE